MSPTLLQTSSVNWLPSVIQFSRRGYETPGIGSAAVLRTEDQSPPRVLRPKGACSPNAGSFIGPLGKLNPPVWTPVPILMYHAVEDAPRPPQYKHFYVLAKEFAGQMRMLKRAGYTAITFDALEAAQSGGTPLPPKPVLLTFDDGYANLLPNVHPLLRELQFPYTVFLVSTLVGKTNGWVAAEGFEPTPLLTWEQTAEMQADGGVDFQPHTATHPHLADLTQEQTRRELVEAKEVLEQRLQRPMKTLCYPYGSYNDVTQQLAREAGYTQAVTTDFGRVRHSDGPLRLPRISVYHVPPVSLTYGIGSLNFRWRLETRKDTRP